MSDSIMSLQNFIYSYLYTLLEQYKSKYESGYKELSICLLLLVYMVTEPLIFSSRNYDDRNYSAVLMKYIFLLLSYCSFLKCLHSGFKKLILDEAIPYSLRAVYPEIANIDDFINKAKKSDQIEKMNKSLTKTQGSSNQTIISSIFISEYTNIPESLLNFSKGYNTNQMTKLHHSLEYENIACARYLSYFTSAYHLNRYFSKVYIVFDAELRLCINNQGFKVKEGQYQFKNFHSIFSKVITTSILFRFFDTAIIKSSSFLNCINECVEAEKKPGLKCLLEKFLGLERFGLPAYSTKVKEEFERQLKILFESHKESKKKRNSVIQFVIDNPKIFDSQNTKLLSTSIIRVIILAQILLSDYISLIFASILDRKKLIRELYEEQQHIMKKYGNALGTKSLSQMFILEAAIKESIRLGLPINSFHRKAVKDIVFSNGVTVPEGSHLGFNTYSHNRSANYCGGKSCFEFDHTRHLKKKAGLQDVSPDNMTWFVGPRMCVAREFSAPFLKMVFAVVIRKYRFESLYTSKDVKSTTMLHKFSFGEGVIFTKRTTFVDHKQAIDD